MIIQKISRKEVPKSFYTEDVSFLNKDKIPPAAVVLNFLYPNTKSHPVAYYITKKSPLEWEVFLYDTVSHRYYKYIGEDVLSFHSFLQDNLPKLKNKTKEEVVILWKLSKED